MNGAGAQFRERLQIGVGAVSIEGLLIGKSDDVQFVRMIGIGALGKPDPPLDASSVAPHDLFRGRLELLEFSLASGIDE